MADVWSRSGSKYRVRAIVLLTVNVLLFGGATSFAHWLRSGVVFAPARFGYWDSLVDTFRGVGEPDVSLAAFLMEPISIHDVPAQIPIVGLLMAALISVPILVAILYRFWASLPFILLVGLIAVMPWLAITLFGSCVIASVRPFRTRIRFMSAMLALIPAILYLVLAWSGTRDVVVGRIDPIDRVKFVAPWVLAIVAAAVVFAVVLSIARIVNYRPGAVTPLLAVMFAIPVLLFENHVGRDELSYRLLKRLDAAYFAEVDTSLGLEEAARRAWESLPLPRPPRELVRDLEEKKWLFDLASDLRPRADELERRKSEIARRADRFHHQFPDSRYTPDVLFLKARALDMRLDVPEFRRTRWIRCYSELPSPASRPTWEIVARHRADMPAGAMASLRLAQLEAQDCDIDRAKVRLRELLGRFQDHDLVDPQASADWGRGARTRGDARMPVSLDPVLLEARSLLSLLEANTDELFRWAPMCGGGADRQEPAFGFVDLDARQDDYLQRLNLLSSSYPQCQLTDNIELEKAKGIEDPRARIDALELVLERFSDRDSAPEVMLRLALAYSREGRTERVADVMDRLLREHPESAWARQGRQLRLPARSSRERRAE